MKFESLDPRINRADIPDAVDYEQKEQLDQWETYEVFHQKARGDNHTHVGCVHAPNPEIAMLFAKEQYSRRMKCVNLWVVKTSNVYASPYEDSDMFEPATDKSYREAYGYKNKHMITEYKKKVAEQEATQSDPA